MDKQIIINGVPVQDCCYFDYENDGYEDSCYIHQNECSAQNCYYKQLLRKEQECEELKETFDGLLKVQYKLADNCKKLRQTLTEIKEIASINAINTCWTVLNLCDKCEEKQDCDIQCPLFKFKLILQKISEVIYE